MKYSESGRPPGALSGGVGRRRRTTTTPPASLLQEWELRDRYYQYDDDQAQQQQQYLVEEVESDEDEEDGVIDGAYALDHRNRTPTRQRGGLYDGNAMIHEGGGAFERDYYSDEDYSPPTSRERERDEMLMQSAYARIARAREKGRSNVNLSKEEMQALERGRMMEGGRRTSGPQALERRTFQLPEPSSSALATPPITPAAAAISSKAKDKVKATSSRSSSAASLASLKKSGRKSTGLIGSPAKSNSKAKVMRNGSVSSEQQPPMVETFAPPGMRLVNGPHGVPVYAPIEYPAIPGRGSPSMSRSRSGSQQRRDSMTPPRVGGGGGGEYPPTSISTRYRPGSSSSSLRDDGEMAYDYAQPGLPAGRQRSVSNARSYQNMPYGYEYGERPISRHQPEQGHYVEPVRYASLRRAPPPSAVGGGGGGGVGSRERVLQRVPTNGSTESSSEGSEEQGVRVEVRGVEGGGYAVVRRGDEEDDGVEGVLSEGKGSKVKGSAGSGSGSKGRDLARYSAGSVRKRKGGKR